MTLHELTLHVLTLPVLVTVPVLTLPVLVTLSVLLDSADVQMALRSDIQLEASSEGQTASGPAVAGNRITFRHRRKGQHFDTKVC